MKKEIRERLRTELNTRVRDLMDEGYGSKEALRIGLLELSRQVSLWDMAISYAMILDFLQAEHIANCGKEF